MGLTVMIVDKGARAHVLSEAYERSPNVKKIIVAPGNDFIGFNRKKEVIILPADVKNPQTFLEIARKYQPDIIDVAQDDAIAAGTVDILEKNGFKTFGPSQQAAQIESNKKWSRDFMKANKIPHPSYESFSDESSAKDYIEKIYKQNPSAFLFVKASGLCGGKGAIPIRNFQDGIQAIESMKKFGEAGKEFVIEEGMNGEEVSVYAICDGENYVVVKNIAQDHKRVFAFDQGENTGGMGTYSPVSLVTPELMKVIEEETIAPVINGMKKIGIYYCGILYVGLMIDGKDVKVVEYNSRWGAPEAEVIIPSIKTPIDEIVFAVLGKRLKGISIEEDGKTRICIVGASKGYPGDYNAVKGKRIYGLEEVTKIPGISVFGAGIAVKDGKFYANGGRLFSIVAEGKDILEARQKALSAMSHVYVEGNNLHFRHDIGWREMKRFYEKNT